MDKRFWKRNGSTILTIVGSVGVVATAVTTAKASIKASKIIEEAKQEKGEELTNWEKVKVVTPTYLPPALIAGGTVACVIGANILNKKNQAALASAYALLDQSYRQYRNKVIELYGEETHQEIVNAIAIEDAEDIYMYANYIGSGCYLAVEEHGSERKLFYEEYSNRYFTTTIEQVITAEYHLNRNYTLRGFAILNELYEFLGLEPTEYGSVMGWAPRDNDMYWIEFNHRKIITPDGKEAYILEMPFEPSLDYDEYY